MVLFISIIYSSKMYYGSLHPVQNCTGFFLQFLVALKQSIYLLTSINIKDLKHIKLFL